MKILEKRPLAIILCVMLGGFSFFADFDWKTKLVIAVIPLVAIGIIYLFETLKSGRKVIVILSLSLLSLSIILSSVWSIIFYPIQYYNKNVSFTARIYEIDNSKSTGSKITCKTEIINGKRDKHSFVFYTDKKAAQAIRKYDIISASANVQEFATQDDGFDGKTYYVSSGYSGLLEDVTNLKIIDNKPDVINSFFKGLQLKISNRLKLHTDFETGSFLSALLVGDRSSLGGNIKLNFARLGISHILALSGMHLAMLTFALNAILIRLMVNKKFRISAIMLIVAFYMALTGFSASVVRSGLMLIISGTLYLLSNKADALTSLLISVFLIVAFSPTSVFDLSLWLSAFATMGVIVFSEIAQRPDKDASFIKKISITLKNGCLVTIFAVCATFAFTASKFDSFSIISIVSTLIFSVIIQIFIYAGLFLLIIGGILPVGNVVIYISNGILWIAEIISSWKFIYVSGNSLVVKLLIVILSVYFFALLVLDIKNKRKGVAILLVLMISVFAVAQINTLVSRYDDDLLYSPSDSGDIILSKANGNVSAIYSGRAVTSGSWEILDYFASEKLTYIDNFIFTGYSHSTLDFANEIIDGIRIEKIMLPRPTTSEEKGQAEGISYLLSGYGTRLEFYKQYEYINLDGCYYRLFEKADYTYGQTPRSVFEVVYDNSRITYMTPCSYTSLSASAKHLIDNSRNLVIGTYQDSTKFVLDIRLQDLKRIHYSNENVLSDDLQEHNKKIGASTYLVKTPISLLN